MTNVHLGSEQYQPDGGRVYRVWRATVRAADGSTREMDTQPVLHQPVPPSETRDERLKRENAEQQRIVRALRALDDVAASAHRTKELRRDRERKRKQAAQPTSPQGITVEKVNNKHMLSTFDITWYTRPRWFSLRVVRFYFGTAVP